MENLEIVGRRDENSFPFLGWRKDEFWRKSLESLEIWLSRLELEMNRLGLAIGSFSSFVKFSPWPRPSQKKLESGIMSR